MDEADIGQAIEIAFRELAIAQVCDAIEPVNSEICVLVKVKNREREGCGERIESKRAALGVTSCLACQQEFEKEIRTLFGK